MTELEHELSIYYSYLLRRKESNLFAGENICAFEKKVLTHIYDMERNLKHSVQAT